MVKALNSTSDNHMATKFFYQQALSTNLKKSSMWAKSLVTMSLSNVRLPAFKIIVRMARIAIDLYASYKR